jgi:hypothetical protein
MPPRRNEDRRAVVLFDDVGRLGIHGLRGDRDGADSRGRLHRIDQIIAHALIAEGDHIARLHALLHAVGADMRGDHFFTDAALHHRHDVGRADRAAELAGPLRRQIGILAVHRGPDERAA